MLHFRKRRNPRIDRFADSFAISPRVAMPMFLCWLLFPIHVETRAAAADVPIRVLFQFDDNLARGQYDDPQIPREERDLSEKLALACQSKLPYWTFTAATLEDVTKNQASQTAPVLKIWIEHSTEMRIAMTFSVRPATSEGTWYATLIP